MIFPAMKTSASAPTIRAAKGPQRSESGGRRRPRAGIGGIAGITGSGEMSRRLMARLGTGGQLLDCSTHSPDLVAHWDACSVGGRNIVCIDDWVEVVTSGSLTDVEGAFALAWWHEGAVHLVRDHIGERTLFYVREQGGLIFASSVHALLSSAPALSVDLPSVASYLSYAYIPGSRTLVEGVRELRPAEHVTFCTRSRALTRRRYWALPGDAGVEPRPLPDDARMLRARLEHAVARRLPAGETVAATLSGGVDSSLVVALAARLHDAPVETYSVMFGSRYPNELAYSSLVARHCGTDHHVVEISPKVVLHHLDDSIGMLSKPIGDPLTVPNSLLFREASQRAAVVLNGEGGDPCFGGPKNLPMVLSEIYDVGGEDPLARERNYLRVHSKCYPDLDAVLCPEVLEALDADPLEPQLTPYLRDPRWKHFVNKLMAANVDLKGGHHILPKIDQLSGQFGVLPRSPLFDRRVVEAAFQIVPHSKLCGSVEKYVLKVAVADLLPRAILLRAKSGMRVPVEGWFRTSHIRHAKARLLDGLAPYGLIRQSYIRRLLDNKEYVNRRGLKIWMLMVLESWLRTAYSGGSA